MPAEIHIRSTAADLASQVRAVAVKDVAAIAGGYPRGNHLPTHSLLGHRPFIKQGNGFRRTRK